MPKKEQRKKRDKNYFDKHPIIKGILSALLVAVCGFILWNITFLVDFLFQSAIDWIVKLFVSTDINMAWHWYPPLKHFMFLALICLISWPIFRSKMRVLFKAIYMTVPLAVILITIGIFLYQWPVVPYIVGGLFSLGVLYYLYKTKQPWLYYYTVIFVSIVMLIVGLAGVEI